MIFMRTIAVLFWRPCGEKVLHGAHSGSHDDDLSKPPATHTTYTVRAKTRRIIKEEEREITYTNITYHTNIDTIISVDYHRRQINAILHHRHCCFSSSRPSANALCRVHAVATNRKRARPHGGWWWAHMRWP